MWEYIAGFIYTSLWYGIAQLYYPFLILYLQIYFKVKGVAMIKNGVIESKYVNRELKRGWTVCVWWEKKGGG